MLDAILAQSRNTALIMGLVALIGLLLQKKSAVDTGVSQSLCKPPN